MVFDAFRTLDGEEATCSHNTEVTTQGTDTANVFVSNKALDGFAVVKDFKVDGVDGTFDGERGLELTDLNGKLIARLVLQVSVNEHGLSRKVALNLVGKTFDESAFNRQTHAAHTEVVVEEVTFVA